MMTILAACLAAAGAFAGGLLTGSGLAASLAVGISVSLVGWNGLFLLGFFFGSSYLLERLFRPAEEVEAKGSRRDAVQVAANGGAAAVAGLVYSVFPAAFIMAAFAASLAAATSDTWASAAGKRTAGTAVLIISRKRVKAGVSGAVTAKGSSWAFGGAVLTAAAAYLLFADITALHALIIAAAGFTGQLIDSAVGEKLQLLYTCPVCGEATEKEQHCGKPTFVIKGIRGINNDAVNMIATCSAAFLAGFCVLLFT
ncbi:DUF92 domain-containing protein [Alkalicoccus luteus]|uniref:DUF92 domain-containing protein n=1 Tax=Alkalicoccus luteus TaxID=1237094 RepID=UPI004033A0A5